MRVWDVFCYWREQWAVKARLSLWAGVDGYTPVALVGDRTHRGTPITVEAPDGVEVVRVTLDADGDWSREAQQRDAVLELLPRMQPDDLVLLCDADEFVDPRAFPGIVSATESGPVKLRMALYVAGTRWRNPQPWRHAAACRARDLPQHPTDDLRMNFMLPKVDAGWHLTYFGSDEDVDLKLRAFAHAECDTPQYRADVAALRESGSGWIDDPLASPLAEVLT